MTSDEVSLIRGVARGETAEAAGRRLKITPRQVRRWCERWARKGWYAYRGGPELGWLTDAGRAKAAAV